MIFASSGATYGNPHYLPMDEEHPQLPESPYGITKLMSEHYLAYYARDRGVAFTALRYGNVYGPRQDPFGEAGVVAIFTQQLLDGRDADDPLGWQADPRLRQREGCGPRQSRGCDARRRQLLLHRDRQGTSVNQIFRLLCDAHRARRSSRITRARRPGDLRHAHFDCARGRADLGWQANRTPRRRAG